MRELLFGYRCWHCGGWVTADHECPVADEETAVETLGWLPGYQDDELAELATVV